MASLAQLGLDRLPRLGPALRADAIAGVSADSRAVRPGFLFAALSGTAARGADFLGKAAEAGAICALSDLESALRAREALGGLPIPVLIDPDPRRRLALAAAAFYDAQPQTVVAVTGTAGKSSVASFCRQLWTAMGASAISLGTVGVEGAMRATLSATTPDPVTLHALLAEAAGKGVTRAAMEASSHGLDQRRLDGVRLAAGAFLNLGRDHMDYHRDAADYAAAKLGLFARVLPDSAGAVVNADAPLADAAADLAASRDMRLIRFGASESADLRLLGADFHDAGQRLRYAWRGEAGEAELPLIGGFQGENALAAAALLIAAGEDPRAALAALPSLVGVRGRMELVATLPNGARGYVDYAHKPEALAAALAALRLHTPGKLVVVFGAGGDRDPGKRRLMGEAAARAADTIIVTDDNPRSEDPAVIRAAVLEGCPDAEDIGDRAEAIAQAVARLRPGDRLLVAGKGHETGQVVGGETRPFDDAETLRAAAHQEPSR